MLRFVLPRVSTGDLPPMFRAAAFGALVAGAYGVAHDQITFAISSEYFTKLKFEQFRYADFGLGDRVFVSTIGFLATWWVGLVAGWFLARRSIPGQPRPTARRQILLGMVCVFAFALMFGLAGYLYGTWRGPDADYSSWDRTCLGLGVVDRWAFVRVAYIHNAGYLGGAIGLVVALVIIRRKP